MGGRVTERRVQLRLPALHAAQQIIYQQSRRFNVIACGRRFGKTRFELLARHIPGIFSGKRHFWVASRTPAATAWGELEALAMQTKLLKVSRVDRKVLCPMSGGWTQVKSTDSEGGLRSQGLDGVTVDEAAHIRHLRDLWQQELRPSLADRKGWADFISTPKGMNEFYGLWSNAENYSKNWAHFQFPTSANPYIDPSEIAAARAELPDLVFRQEYLAEFVQFAGALFKREHFVIADSPPAHRN